MGPEKDVLDSWKEIAAHIRRDVRTCQRWERELGLPVRRISGKSRARVFALKADIDRWLESESTHNRLAETPPVPARKRKRFRPIIIAALALAAISVVAIAFLSRPAFGRLGTEKVIRLTELGINPLGLAWSGKSFGVLWSESDRKEGENKSEGHFFFALLNQNGKVLVEPFLLSIPDNRPATGGCLIWNEKERTFAAVLQVGDKADLFFLTIDEHARRSGSAVRLTEDDVDSTGPVIVWTGEFYALAWFDYKQSLKFTTLDSEGRFLFDPVTIYEDIDPRYPSLAWNKIKNEFAIAWNNMEEGKRDIYFAIVNSQGEVVVPPRKAAGHFGEKQFASIAWNDTSYGLAWMDRSRGNGIDIMFAGIDSSGNRIDPSVAGVVVDRANNGQPRLFWLGREYYLGCIREASSRRKSIVVVRFGADGKAISEPGFKRRASGLTAFTAAKADQWLGLIYAHGRGGSNRLVFTGIGEKDLPPVPRAKKEYHKAPDGSGKVMLTAAELDDGSYSPQGKKIKIYLDNPGPYTSENDPADVHLFVKDAHGRQQDATVRVFVDSNKPVSK